MSQRARKVERAVRDLTSDRRASYLFPTKAAADAVRCVPNKFGEWWYRTQRKLIALHLACPAEFAAEIASLIALAESQRQRRGDQ